MTFSFYSNRCNHVGGAYYMQFPPRCERERGHTDLPHSVRACGVDFYWDDDGFMLQVKEGKKG